MTFQRKVWAFQRRFVQLNHPPPVSGGEQTRSDYRKGGTNKMVVLGMVERDTGRAREQPAKGGAQVYSRANLSRAAVRSRVSISGSRARVHPSASAHL